MADVTALPAALVGCKLIPLRRGTKVPAVPHATFDAAVQWDPSVDRFLAEGNRVGVMMGEKFVALDADLKMAYDDAPDGSSVMTMRNGLDDIERLMKDAGLQGLPRTLKVRTQGGGIHLVFRQNASFRVTQRTIGCLDIRAARNSYIAIGAGYEVLDDGGGQLAELPEALARAIMTAQSVPSAGKDGPGTAELSAQGTYGNFQTAFNNMLASALGHFLRMGVPDELARDWVRHMNATSPDPIPDWQLSTTVLSDKRSWERGEMISDDLAEWARNRIGISADDPELGLMDIPTVRRLWTTDKYREKKANDEAAAEVHALMIMSGADAKIVTPKPWLADRIIPDGAGTGALSGPMQSYKTTTSLLLGAAIATGRPFLGRKTRQGTVAFVAGESADDTRRMMGKIAGTDELVFVEGSFCLSEYTAPVFANRIRSHLNGRPEPVLVIFDALSRFHKSKENDASEMLAVHAGAVKLSEEFGAFVLLLGHTGRDGEHIRGSSAWEQAFLTDIYTDGTLLRFRKQKGIELPEDIWITLRHTEDSISVSEGMDMAVMSQKIVKINATQQRHALDGLSAEPGCSATRAREIIRGTISVNNQEANEILTELITAGRVQRVPGKGRQPTQIIVTEP